MASRCGHSDRGAAQKALATKRRMRRLDSLGDSLGPKCLAAVGAQESRSVTFLCEMSCRRRESSTSSALMIVNRPSPSLRWAAVRFDGVTRSIFARAASARR